MTIRVAINGFGRIGRLVLRHLYNHKLQDKVQVVGINDLTDARTLAHLLKYDSVHRTFQAEVKAGEQSLSVNGHEIAVTAIKDPSQLPWKTQAVDVVLECTGVFTDREKAALHLQAGARKVLISAPSKNADSTIAFGVNQEMYDHQKHDVVSCASCTTNCLAPVAKVLVDQFGVVCGTMTTIHSFTNDQNVLDLPHRDLRRARAAGLSMIPTSTGAAKAIGLVIPALAGKCDGFAVRVPTPDVSLVDFVVQLERDATAQDLNAAFRKASESSLKGILAYSEEPLVSSDFIGSTYSATLDALSTMVLQKRLAKVVAWYDNEVGFSARMVDLVSMLGRRS